MGINFRPLGIDKEEHERFLNATPQIETVIPAYKGFNEKAWETKKIESHRSGDELNYVRSLLIDEDTNALNLLEKQLNYYCPLIKIQAKVQEIDQARTWIETSCPDLVFLDLGDKQENRFNALAQNNTTSFETIFTSNNDLLDIANLQYHFSGCLTKPIQQASLLKVVLPVQNKILDQKEHIKDKRRLNDLLSIKSQKDVIGIPTVNGFDFLPVESIICCEGMQKCTNIISKDSQVLSSYNIGEFRKLLHPFGFYSPHKSFLINLSKIKKYHKEGTLTMSNDHHIPIARRKKESFLWHIKKDLKFPIIPSY